MPSRKSLLTELINPFCIVCVASFLAIMVLLPTTAAFANYVSNDSNNMTENQNTSSYGVHIVIVQHLIEIDQTLNPGYLKVVETIIFRNAGTQNHTGPIYTWLQDGAFDIIVTKEEMAMTGQKNNIDTFQVDDNVIGWNDIISIGMSMPSLYHIEYMVPVKSGDESTGPNAFSKKLVHTATVDYEYAPMPGMSSLVLKLIVTDEMEFNIVDNLGTGLQADHVEDINNIKTYNWVQLQFSGIYIEMKEAESDGSTIILYLGIVLVIIGTVSYFILKKRSPAIKGIEEKLGSIIPKEHDDDIYHQMQEEYEDEDESQSQEVLNKNDISNFNQDELIKAKKAVIKVLMELDDDFSNGILSEKEYNTIRGKYKKKAIDINKRIDMSD